MGHLWNEWMQRDKLSGLLFFHFCLFVLTPYHSEELAERCLGEGKGISEMDT